MSAPRGTWPPSRMPPGDGSRTPGSRPSSPTRALFRSADVVNLDLKSTLRVLYNLFTKYKNLE